MPRARHDQTMKPATAAKKLDVYLPATPEEFRAGPVSRSELDALQSDPPEWLTTLRREGPHPRDVVARRLGVSVAALRRAGQDGPLTTADIKALIAAPPEWLVAERARAAEVRAEAERLRAAAQDPE